MQLNTNQINAFISELENPKQFDSLHGTITEGDTITFANNYYSPASAGQMCIRKVLFIHTDSRPVVRFFGRNIAIDIDNILASCK